MAWRWITVVALAAVVWAVGCRGPEAFNRIDSMTPPVKGAAGTGASATGSAGVFGTAGTNVIAGGNGGGGASAAGVSGARDAGGVSDAVVVSDGGGGIDARGPVDAVSASDRSARADVGVTGGAGTGGAATGAAGTGAAGAGTAGTGGPAGTAGAGGAPGPAGCAGLYCDGFEGDAAGSMPARWTRVGGSDGDWRVVDQGVAGGRAFAQDHAQSSTLRLCFAMGAAGAPWSGAIRASARVKILLAGSSGTTDALLCARYALNGDSLCLVLQAGVGARVRTRVGGATTDGPVWAATVAIGTAYDVQLAVDAAGALSASLDGKPLGTAPSAGAVASGFVAVGTQSAEASFDDIVVTRN